jgi:Uma2 family endonuclease
MASTSHSSPRIRIPRKQRFVLTGEPWSAYVRWSRMLRDRRNLRITYDRGVLEIVTLTHEHENSTALLALLIYVWTDERGLPKRTGKSTTMRRRDLKRGLEPDECFWIANAARMRGVKRLDLRRDPPPDLVVEVDVTHSVVPRLPIYAALGVPEVWRVDPGLLMFQSLQPNGTYAPTAVSAALSPLTPADLQPFLALRDQIDENDILRQFRAWVRTLPPPTP